MLAGAVLAHAQASVIATGPSDHQAERIILDPNDDLLNQGADDPLSGCRRRTGAVPGGLDVGAEGEQALALGLGKHRFRAYGKRIPVVFESAHREQAFIPALLQLGGDQAVVGVDRVILPTGPGCLIAGLLDCQLDLMPLLRVLCALCFEGAERPLDAEGLETVEHLGSDSSVNPHAAERDAGSA